MNENMIEYRFFSLAGLQNKNKDNNWLVSLLIRWKSIYNTHF